MEDEKSKTSKITLLIGAAVALVLAGTLYLMSGAEKTRAAFDAANNLPNETTGKGAVIVTNLGSIEIAFLPEKAPKTVENFVGLVQKKFYDGTKFHRVIKNFMIQGGDPNSKGADESTYGRGGPGYTFADEINDEPMIRGAVAMANSGPNTNGSQFFIITAAQTPWLQGKHTVFAKVTKGMEVGDKISAVQTKTGDVPVKPVMVERMILR